MSTDAKPIRRPDDITQQSISTMVEQWSTLQLRNLLSHHPDPDDLFADLAYRTRIAQEITYGRWCVVADILRTGTTTSWAEIAAALDMTETQARDGFRAWTTGQLDLHRRTGTIGLTEAASKHLHAESEALARLAVDPTSTGDPGNGPPPATVMSRSSARWRPVRDPD